MSLRSSHFLRFLPLLLIGLIAGNLLWRQQQGPLLPVVVASQQVLLQQVVASGEVRSDSLVRIGSELIGVVKQRTVREGDRVAAGDLLLQLEDSEQQARVEEAAAALQQLTTVQRPQATAVLRDAEQTLQRAEAELARREALALRDQVAVEQVEAARSAVATARAQHEQAALQVKALAAGGPQEQQAIQRLEAARAALARTRITAPVAGVVQTRNVEPGDLVQPGSTLLELAREQSLKIVVPVDEKSISGLSLGQSALVIADAYADRVIQAQLGFMAPAVDPTRGTLAVDLELLEPAPFLRQGMTVSASIETGRREAALVLPNDVLFDVEGNSATVLMVRDGRVSPASVSLGLRGAVATEIVAGLEPGAELLTQRLEPGSRVRVLRRSGE